MKSQSPRLDAASLSTKFVTAQEATKLAEMLELATADLEHVSGAAAALAKSTACCCCHHLA